MNKNLKGVNLQGADLRDANLRNADLYGANLCGANLQDANLWGASLQGANLQDANLQSANLYGANLQSANLCGASLRSASLRSASLYGANLRGANLCGANLQGAMMPYIQIPKGRLDVWKSCNGTLVKLRIPAKAKRTGCWKSNKCRAEYAVVLNIFNRDKLAYSSFTTDCVYRIGETIYPDKYNDDPRIECTNGIHFFLVKEEAEKSGF